MKTSIEIFCIIKHTNKIHVESALLYIQLDRPLFPSVLNFILVYVRTKYVITGYIFNVFQLLQRGKIISFPSHVTIRQYPFYPVISHVCIVPVTGEAKEGGSNIESRWYNILKSCLQKMSTN
jgi:hypothetical protein